MRALTPFEPSKNETKGISLLLRRESFHEYKKHVPFCNDDGEFSKPFLRCKHVNQAYNEILQWKKGCCILLICTLIRPPRFFLHPKDSFFRTVAFSFQALQDSIQK